MVLNFHYLLAAVILTAVSAILTGGLHLDRLSDTFDALLSRRGREDMAIMRDPHAGAMGVIAIVLVLLIKVVLLDLLLGVSPVAAIIMPLLISRWSMVFAMDFFSYARKDGKAKMFIDAIDKNIFLGTTLIVIAIILLLAGTKGLILFAASAAAAYITGSIARKNLGGITGDILGAISEISEVVVLLAAYVVWS